MVVVAASLLVSALLAEAALRVLAPQDRIGNRVQQDESGLFVNKSRGHTLHEFGDLAVTYTFAPHHSRAVANPVKDAEATVLVTGDSFTFGWLLEDAETYVSLLQDRFRRYRFVNASGSGWGTADYVRYVETYCTAVRPQLVLVFLNTDDIGRAARSPLYDFADGKLTPRDRPVDPVRRTLNALPFYNFVLEHSHLLALMRSVIQPVNERPGFVPDKMFPNSEMADATQRKDAVARGQALFRRLKDASDACGARLVVLYTGWEDPALASGDRDPTMLFLREAPAFFARNGIAYHDLSRTREMSAVIANRPDYFIPADWHPNAQGADAIFRAAARTLTGTVLQP
ncbi:SGNH/GDSL hydrolase family protein [Xanthobacteraceae bacterium A53D]